MYEENKFYDVTTVSFGFSFIQPPNTSNYCTVEIQNTSIEAFTYFYFDQDPPSIQTFFLKQKKEVYYPIHRSCRGSYPTWPCPAPYEPHKAFYRYLT